MEKNPQYEVRLAQVEDRPAILDLTRLLHSENGLFQLSPQKVDRMMDRYFDKSGAIIGVIGDVGAPVASIYLGLTQPPYTDEWIIAEEFSFVHPEHRRSPFAGMLIAYAKAMSDGMQLPLVIGVLSNTRTEAKVKLYERSLDRVGAYFVYNRHLAGGVWEP